MQSHNPDRLVEPLTEREQDVLQLLAQGLSNREQAEALVLSVNTIKWYNRQIYEKLAVANRQEAAARARELGLVPAGHVQSAVNHNLPAALSTFFGREQAIEELRQQVIEKRLVTLIGPGGIGKSRLALEAARELPAKFEHGVWLVELAMLSDADLLPRTIVKSLPLHDEASEALLQDYLREKDLLLILDNCEHVISMCAGLAERLLQHCPRLHILVTSREALNISGESIVPVGPLSLPETGGDTPSSLANSEAAQLFAARAVEALPAFRKTAENAPAIGQICRRLDGIPLALELAASKITMLNAAQIAARLDESFRLLDGGRRTALPRQKTLWATIEWSYNLLAENERILFRRLAVFAGGWTLEAAEAVCAGGEIAPAEVMALLGGLVNKSLVVRTRQPGVEARYRLLDTIGEYALHRSLESGQLPEVRERHLQWFLSLAEKSELGLRGSGQTEWLKRLEADHDNFRAALAWAFEQDNVHSALALAASLTEFWIMHDHANEGKRWLNMALDRAGNTDEEETPVLRARAQMALAAFASARYGEPSRSLIGSSSEALKILRAVDDRTHIVGLLRIIATLKRSFGELEEAQSLVEEAVAIAQREGNRNGAGRCLCSLGIIVNEAGDYAAATEYFDRGLEALRETGDKWFLGRYLFYWGHLAWYAGDIGRATDLFRLGLEAFEPVVIRTEIVRLTRWIAEMAAHEGRYAEAQSVLNDALYQARHLGNRQMLGLTLADLGNLLHRLGRLDEALACQEESVQLFREVGDRGNMGWAMANAGRALLSSGDVTRAGELLQGALPLIELGFDRRDLTYALLGLADYSRMQGHYEEAEATYQRCLTGKLFVPAWPDCLEGLGKTVVQLGELERAAWLFGAAEQLRDELGLPLPPVARPDYERHLALLRDGLGEDKLAASWDSGAGMTMAEARGYFPSGVWSAFVNTADVKTLSD